MERSKDLRNLALAPCLKWGKQRLLRCMNVDRVPAMSGEGSSDSGERDGNRSGGRRVTESDEFEWQKGVRSSDNRQVRVRFRTAAPPSPATEISFVRKRGAEEISEAREKVMHDFQTAVGKMQNAIFTPLNLNSKKETACNAPPPDAVSFEGGPGGGTNVDDPKGVNMSTRPRRNGEKKAERAKFSVSLSRGEIEADFVAMTGRKPPRKPKKRSKIVQNQLNTLFPGLWLTEVNLDQYKVNENGKG